MSDQLASSLKWQCSPTLAVNLLRSRERAKTALALTGPSHSVTGPNLANGKAASVNHRRDSDTRATKKARGNCLAPFIALT